METPPNNETILDIKSISNYNRYSQGIESTYNVGTMTYHSMALDLVAIYLKGQKLLYTESKTYCEMILYALMLPTIFISTLCTVINVPLKSESYGSVIVSSLNGINSLLLSVITYLKLDAKAEAHKAAAYQFEKLQTSCEFYSGKTSMLPDDNIEESVNLFIDSIETKVREIKETNQFVIPQSIRYRYNDIYSYNVFVVMKEYKTSRILNVQKLLDVSNEIQWRKKQNNKEYTEDEITSHFSHDFVIPKKTVNTFTFLGFGFRNDKQEDNDEIYRNMNIYEPTTTLSKLYKIRETCIKDIIKYRNLSSDLNISFNRQIENRILETNGWRHRLIFNTNWLKT
jgi:hypothetical protein